MREQIEQIAALLQRQAAQDVRGAERVEGLAHRADTKALHEVWRRAQHELAQYIGDRLKLSRECLDAIGIVCTELFDRWKRAAFARQQIAAVWRGQEILGAALDDRKAALAQFEVRNNFRVHETDDVGRDRLA